MMIMGGKGTGKTAFSDVIMSSVSDGDLQTKLDGVDYSTTPREVVTIDQMVKHEQKKVFRLKMNSVYGKYGN